MLSIDYSSKTSTNGNILSETSTSREITEMTVLQTFSIFVAFSSLALGEEPIVNTNLGKVQGQYAMTRGGRQIATFLGMPYAKPPIGTLRFKVNIY